MMSTTHASDHSPVIECVAELLLEQAILLELSVSNSSSPCGKYTSTITFWLGRLQNRHTKMNAAIVNDQGDRNLRLAGSGIFRCTGGNSLCLCNETDNINTASLNTDRASSGHVRRWTIDLYCRRCRRRPHEEFRIQTNAQANPSWQTRKAG